MLGLAHFQRKGLARGLTPGPGAACRMQGLQGGPHNHTISALAVALKMANTAEFKEYQKQVSTRGSSEQRDVQCSVGSSVGV